MDSKQIRTILKGNFSDPRDRKYWEDALKEAERKEANMRGKAYVKEFERAARENKRIADAMLRWK